MCVCVRVCVSVHVSKLTEALDCKHITITISELQQYIDHTKGIKVMPKSLDILNCARFGNML